jgi:hypothetical protein
MLDRPETASWNFSGKMRMLMIDKHEDARRKIKQEVVELFKRKIQEFMIG